MIAPGRNTHAVARRESGPSGPQMLPISLARRLGVTIPPGTLRPMEQAARDAARAAGIELAAGLLAEARTLVSGAVPQPSAAEGSGAVLSLSSELW